MIFAQFGVIMKIQYKNNINGAKSKRMAKRINRRTRSIERTEVIKNERIKFAAHEEKLIADVASILKKESASEKLVMKRP
jgi:hypothetical protein